MARCYRQVRERAAACSREAARFSALQRPLRRRGLGPLAPLLRAWQVLQVRRVGTAKWALARP